MLNSPQVQKIFSSSNFHISFEHAGQTAFYTDSVLVNMLHAYSPMLAYVPGATLCFQSTALAVLRLDKETMWFVITGGSMVNFPRQ